MKNADVKRKNKFHLLFWMILGIAVVVSQVNQPVLAKASSKIEQSAQSDDETSEVEHVSVSTDLAVSSTVSLNPNQEFYQIREIILDEVADPHVVHVAQKLAETDRFKTLFRKVISTNAP